MHTITVASDGTITRKGAAIMRAEGVTGVTGTTTLASARAKARTAGKTGAFEFVSATRGTAAKAKRTRKVQPTVAAARKATAWECGHATLREHIKARCNGKASV